MLNPKTGFSALATAALFATALPFAAQATVVDLDFGSISEPTFGTAANLLIQYTNVSTGINATLAAAAPFASGSREINGSGSGDARVNLEKGSSVQLTLSLWEAAVGSGFDTAYDPGTDFDWDLVFYDIDGIGANREIVTLLSPSTYTVTTPTDLSINTSVPGQVTFTGGGASNVPNPGPSATTLTAAQARVSVSVNYENTSSVSFIYSITGAPNTSRNLFIDGGTLTLALNDFPTTTGTLSVPVPASGLLLVAGLGALRLVTRKKTA